MESIFALRILEKKGTFTTLICIYPGITSYAMLPGDWAITVGTLGLVYTKVADCALCG